MPYFVEAYADDCKVSCTAWTAKEAFALAVEWRIVRRLSAVSISHDSMSYAIAEFAQAMAKQEIADAPLDGHFNLTELEFTRRLTRA